MDTSYVRIYIHTYIICTYVCMEFVLDLKDYTDRTMMGGIGVVACLSIPLQHSPSKEKGGIGLGSIRLEFSRRTIQ
jgi:hypothetical protein